MSIRPIKATLTRCANHQALIVLDGLFNGLEIRPADLREMAMHLNAVADMAARLPLGGKRWKPTLVEIGTPDRQAPEVKASAAEARA